MFKDCLNLFIRLCFIDSNFFVFVEVVEKEFISLLLMLENEDLC